jgi:GNAT superfamily N-acetyltransferase
MQSRVEWLADHPGLVDTVLAWHWREWSHGEADASLDRWRAQLVERSNRDRIPFTLVAFVDDVAVGSVSVCEEDLDPRYADEGPWLSGMFVTGRARNQGIGRALLRVAEKQSRRFGATELWLFTTEAAAFYGRCGWDVVAGKEGLLDQTVMRRTL